MPYIEYAKPFRNNSSLVVHLTSKGLTISSVPTAEAFLKKINYYRFKVYLRPFLDTVNNRYNSADFNDGIALYEFDRDLRETLFSRVGRLEVKLRSRLDQVVTEHTNNPFWYLDDQLFLSRSRPSLNGVRAKIHSSFQSANDDFVNHFKDKYVNTVNTSYKHLPPFWIAGELTTFGNIIALYQSLDKAKFSTGPRGNKLDDLAKEFGAVNFGVLNNWLLALRDIRNRCAHHSRVWNANFRQPSTIERQLSIQPARTNRIYNLLLVIHVMGKTIGLNLDIKNSLQDLLTKYPKINSFFVPMGIPNQWETDPIWA